MYVCVTIQNDVMLHNEMYCNVHRYGMVSYGVVW